jgi:hypothetical protein
MGLVAVAGGFAYKIIHIIWLKKFDLVLDLFVILIQSYKRFLNNINFRLMTMLKRLKMGKEIN